MGSQVALGQFVLLPRTARVLLTGDLARDGKHKRCVCLCVFVFLVAKNQRTKPSILGPNVSVLLQRSLATPGGDMDELHPRLASQASVCFCIEKIMWRQFLVSSSELMFHSINSCIVDNKMCYGRWSTVSFQIHVLSIFRWIYHTSGYPIFKDSDWIRDIPPSLKLRVLLLPDIEVETQLFSIKLSIIFSIHRLTKKWSIFLFPW